MTVKKEQQEKPAQDKQQSVVNSGNAKSQNQSDSKKPSYEELIKRVQELESKQNKPKSIDDVINFYEEKRKKITHLEQFKQHLSELKIAKDETSKDLDTTEFEESNFALTFGQQNYSSNNATFKISNKYIILEFCDFLIKKIESKIKLLQIEIQKDF